MGGGGGGGGFAPQAMSLPLLPFLVTDSFIIFVPPLLIQAIIIPDMSKRKQTTTAEESTMPDYLMYVVNMKKCLLHVQCGMCMRHPD